MQSILYTSSPKTKKTALYEVKSGNQLKAMFDPSLELKLGMKKQQTENSIVY